MNKSEKVIIEYDIFSNNDMFVMWQKTNNVDVIAISPIPTSISASMSTDDNSNNQVDGKVTASIFVTFVRNSDN